MCAATKPKLARPADDLPVDPWPSNRWWRKPVHRDLRVVAGLLDVLASFAGKVAADHPPGCRCEFCTGEPFAADIVEDLRGVAWAAGVHAGHFNGHIDKLDLTDTYAGDLRLILAELRRKFADAPEPTAAAAD